VKKVNFVGEDSWPVVLPFFIRDGLERWPGRINQAEGKLAGGGGGRKFLA